MTGSALLKTTIIIPRTSIRLKKEGVLTVAVGRDLPLI